MASPSGQYSKLWFSKEGEPGTKHASFGSAAPVGNNFGLRLYQEEFQVTPSKTPIRYEENRGGLSFDHFDFTPGPQAVQARLRFALRYSGVHAVMMGHALGNLGTTGAGSAWTHTADGGGSGRYNSLTFIHHRPLNDAGTIFIETQLLGAKVARMRLSQSVSQPFIICEMDLVAMEAKVVGAITPLGNLPPDSNGFSPTEALVQAAHITDLDGGTNVGNFEFRGRVGGTGQTIAYPRLEEWSIELNNFPQQLGVISNVQRQSSPARGQIREITGSFVMEQDDMIDKIEAAYGLTATDASQEFYLKWVFQDPNDSDQGAQFDVSNAYITQPERGTTGTGPQRRRYNFAAHATTDPTPWQVAFPLRTIIRSNLDGPTGIGGGTPLAEYDNYVIDSF